MFSFFSSPSQQAQQQAAASTNPAVNPALANGQDPSQATGIPPRLDSEQGKSPMDNYKDLWNNAPNQQEQQQPLFNINSEQLQQAVGNMDFMKSVTPEQLQAISTGGQEGMTAFANIMQQVQRNTFATQTEVTTKLIEQAVTKTQEAMMAKIPDLVRQHQVSDTLRQDNPLYADPAVAPLMGALEKQLTVKFPNATAAEIKQHANMYLDGLVGKIQGTKPNAQAQAEPDWGSFFGA